MRLWRMLNANKQWLVQWRFGFRVTNSATAYMLRDMCPLPVSIQPLKAMVRVRDSLDVNSIKVITPQTI